MTVPVTQRDEKETVEVLRAKGGVPAVVYGPKQVPLAIAIDAKAFDKIRKEAGESTIVELTGLADTVEVLIKEVDFDPIKQQVTHVDFYAIERGKEMTTHVPLHFIGEAPVEKSNAGSVTKVLHEVEVTCRPSDLPSHIDVDISILADVSDKIHVSDLVLPSGVTLGLEPEESVAVVSAAKSEKAEEEESAPVDMSAIEVEHKGKAEEEAE